MDGNHKGKLKPTLSKSATHLCTTARVRPAPHHHSHTILLACKPELFIVVLLQLLRRRKKGGSARWQ